MSAGTAPEPTTGKGCGNSRWRVRSKAGVAYDKCGKLGGMFCWEVMDGRSNHPACGPVRFQGWEPHPGLPPTPPGLFERLFGGGA